MKKRRINSTMSFLTVQDRDELTVFLKVNSKNVVSRRMLEGELDGSNLDYDKHQK